MHRINVYGVDNIYFIGWKNKINVRYLFGCLCDVCVLMVGCKEYVLSGGECWLCVVGKWWMVNGNWWVLDMVKL